MRKSTAYFSSLLVSILLIAACTNKRNTVVTRTYHNITSRYNGYYWATESIKDGVFKIEESYKDDYSKILPLFIYPNNESSKTIFPEMDRAIKKSSLVIQRHAIIDKKTKKEVYGAVRWIDDNWLVVGQAHFYKREFFSGIEIFDYVSKSYKSKQRYEAKLWLIRSYNEIGTLSQSEPLIAALKNDKNMPKEYKKELSSLIAEFYIKQGLYEEAAKELETTISLTKNKKKKARFTFVLAQIYEAAKENKLAIKHYNKVIALKPDYEMTFNARIKRARLYDSKDQKVKSVKQELLKMAKDAKNKEFLDVIYYTLGELEEKESHIDQAMVYYKKSAQTSVSNNNQKALSYLKLADNSFEKTAYVNAGAYYDSAVAVLDKNHPDYDNIINKQKNLSALISNLNIIHEEDSLQKMAADSNLRNSVIAKLIKQVEEDEVRKKEELELLKSQNEGLGLGTQTVTTAPTLNGGEWYFYNPQTKAFGVNEFVKKFGNRKLEDNWRRSNKQSSAESLSLETDEVEDTSGVAAAIPKENDKKRKEYYLQALPLTEEKIAASNERILEAFYQLGSIYREALNNRSKAIAAFDEMNRRFPGNKYEANTWYQGYRMSNQDKNAAAADNYKNKLLTKYPESDYTKILKDPDYQSTMLAKKSEVEQYYTETYDLYNGNKAQQVLERTNEALKKFGKNDFAGRFALLRAMSIGKLYGMDSMQTALTSVISKYASDQPVKERAQELMNFITEQKGLKGGGATQAVSLFTEKDSATHYWVCLLPKDFLGINSFSAKLADYNTKYFSNRTLTVTSFQYTAEQTLIYVKEFSGKDEAMIYFEGLEENNEPFDGAALPKNKCTYFVATQENFQKFVQQKKLDDYYQFFLERYGPGDNK